MSTAVLACARRPHKRLRRRRMQSPEAVYLEPLLQHPTHLPSGSEPLDHAQGRHLLPRCPHPFAINPLLLHRASPPSQNVLKMRQKEHENRMRQEAAAMKSDAPRTGRYSNVQSKVGSKTAEAGAGPRKEFMKGGAGAGSPGDKRTPAARGFGFGAVDRGLETKENERQAQHGRRAVGGTMNVPHQLGSVPTYLTNRKAEMANQAAAERKRQELMDSDCPAGMRPMDSAEVSATLKVLQENRSAITAECRRMPLKLETEGQKRRGQDLENKLREIEEAIKIFSRPVVYCKDD